MGLCSWIIVILKHKPMQERDKHECFNTFTDFAAAE